MAKDLRMIGKLNHVGVATPSIEEAWKLYADRPSAETWRHLERDCPLVAQQYIAQRGMPPELASP